MVTVYTICFNVNYVWIYFTGSIYSFCVVIRIKKKIILNINIPAFITCMLYVFLDVSVI